MGQGIEQVGAHQHPNGRHQQQDNHVIVVQTPPGSLTAGKTTCYKDPHHGQEGINGKSLAQNLKWRYHDTLLFAKKCYTSPRRNV